MEILERFLPSYWWTDPGTTIDGTLAIGLAVVLAIALVLAIAAWILAPQIAGGHHLKRRLIARLAKWVVALAIIGLFLLLFRWQIVPFFSKRLWTILWFAAVFGLIGYTVYYWRKVYPVRLAAWEEGERRRRYLPGGERGPGRSRRRSRRRR